MASGPTGTACVAEYGDLHIQILDDGFDDQIAFRQGIADRLQSRAGCFGLLHERRPFDQTAYRAMPAIASCTTSSLTSCRWTCQPCWAATCAMPALAQRR